MEGTMTLNKLLAPLALFFLAFALVAHAATVEQVTADAQALQGDLDALEARVDNCPGGQCGDVCDIVADFADLESRRATLHADRATLSGSFPALDATIAAIDQLAASLGLIIEEWEEAC
jgi:hypothetical protein